MFNNDINNPIDMECAFQARNDNIGISFSLVNLRHFSIMPYVHQLCTHKRLTFRKEATEEKEATERAHGIDVNLISIHSEEPEQSCKGVKRIAVK